MLEIRNFLNADLPVLADLWCIHHATYRNPPAVNRVIFEQAVVSRLFFDASRLLVATSNKLPVAWCHWFPDENRTATLAAICFQTDVIADAAVRDLLHEVENRAKSAGMNDILVGVHHQSKWGYQGLEPIGHGLGIDVADDRTNTLLESAGYDEIKRIDRWEVTTMGYRPVVSRDVLLLRRSSQIQRQIVPALSPDMAAAMIHLDRERHALIDMATRSSLASIDIWTSDPEALVMPPSDAILGDWTQTTLPNQEIKDDIPLRYLISMLIPQLAERRIRSLHRSVTTDNTPEATTLIASNFSRTGAGRLMSKRLVS